MSLRKELDRLKQAWRSREEREQRILFATIIDSSPHASHGYVLARLADGTVVNVQAWTPVALAVGQRIMIAPIGRKAWNWYALIQVNASTDVEATPYTAPVVSTIAAHALGGAAHTGNLSWSRIDTATSKVDLGTQVTGVLPVARQAKQTTRQTFTITTGTIAPAASGSGSLAACAVGYVRRLHVTGGTQMRLQFRETSNGVIEYESYSEPTPFTDAGGWMHSEGNGQALLHWELRNDGTSAASFTVELELICWGI